MIYDFGMNDGSNIDYYLLKSARVVAVDANPRLCAAVQQRFADEVKQGRLIILNVALAESDLDEPVTFYIHKTNHVLSQLPAPTKEQAGDFEPVIVRCRSASSIVREFGEPDYVKIDIEHYDSVVLSDLFHNNVYPHEISAEAHTVKVFASMVEHGYRAFTLVDGASVDKVYKSAKIRTAGGEQPYNFRRHSAGPFGEDIRSQWEDPDTFLHTLAAEGLGWKDIHASRVVIPEQAPQGVARRQARALMRATFRRLLRR